MSRATRPLILVCATLLLLLLCPAAHGDCDFTRPCPSDCFGKGSCVNNQCECQTGYTGVDCSNRTCNNCGPHSDCTENAECDCHQGYGGLNCTILECMTDVPCCDHRGNCACPYNTPTRECLNGEGVDLTVDAGSISAARFDRTFGECHCAVDDGCASVGTRKLIRFNTVTRNIGTADLFIGEPTSEMESFDYHNCHRHFHFWRFASFRLLDEEHNVVTEGIKHGFCLLDTRRIPGFSGARNSRLYTCNNQGLQRGWEDVYSSSLDCQWLDVTDVPPRAGYILEVEANPDRIIVETDYDNNAVRVTLGCGGSCNHGYCDFTKCVCDAGYTGTFCNIGPDGEIVFEEGQLFLALGGENGVRGFVSALYDQHVADPSLSTFFAAVNESAWKAGMEAFMCAVLGGHLYTNCSYQGRPVPDAHRPMRLTDAHFTTFIEHARVAALAQGVTSDEWSGIRNLLAGYEQQVVYSTSSASALSASSLSYAIASFLSRVARGA